MPANADPNATRPVGGVDGKGIGDADRKAEPPTPAQGAIEPTKQQTSQAPNAKNPASEGPDASTDASNGGSAPNAGSNTIPLPEFEVRPLEADETALERAGNTKPIDAHPIAGVWEQIDGPNTADFGPGGYERSIVMLNPATKIAAVYRVFRGSIAIVIGGELALDVPATERSRQGGTCTLRSDPSLSSKFPQARVPLGGSPAKFADPPAGGDQAKQQWQLAWTRDKQTLVLDGKRYSPTTVDAFESIRRGGGDVASKEELKETAPTRAATAAGAGPKPKEAAFFGVRGGGKRFVFIVDVSGSMQGPKLDRAKAELTKSVQTLPPDAEFSIVFFSSDAQVIDQNWMLASRDSARAIQLIAQQGSEGGTDPTAAFDFAFQTLSPVPDCIFFMTDGMIPPWTPDHVRKLNAARIPTMIHAITFGTPGDEPAMRPMMEQIAKENHGTYTFVPN